MLFVSLHADPAFEYPFFLGFADERGWGAGEDCNRNFPLPAGTEWDTYGAALAAALAAVRKFAPDAVIVSLGVDTALEDPDTFRLVADDYPRIGAALAALDRPTLVVQEGGYCLDVLGRNVVGRAARARASAYSPSDSVRIVKNGAARMHRDVGTRAPTRSSRSRPRCAGPSWRGTARSTAPAPSAAGSPMPAISSPRFGDEADRGRAVARARVDEPVPTQHASPSLSRAPGRAMRVPESCSCVAASNSACPAISAGPRASIVSNSRTVRVPVGEQLGDRERRAAGRPARAVHASVAMPSQPAVHDVVAHADEVREHVAGPPAGRRGRGLVERGRVDRSTRAS